MLEALEQCLSQSAERAFQVPWCPSRVVDVDCRLSVVGVVTVGVVVELSDCR